MPLNPGTTLGSYRVTAKIGEGGMGEVYQARDTKLDRDVALKVLPEAFTSDSDRLARFEREAKVLASLNHPNIGSIYGLEEADGVKALVLELIEGPTLSDRIKRGPIPIDEALPIAKQIAEALEAAHEQGVIHRDLKPANVKVKADGTVKVLDFGLAKALVGDAEAADLSQSPTMTASMGGTREGVILGTAAYMSPEQARGKPVDKRTDIWAFGCVLFEMLAGKAAFARQTLSDTITAVMSAAPDWAALPNEQPRVHRVLEACLHRDVKQRVHDVADVRLALDGAFELPAEPQTDGDVRAVSRLRSALPWVAGGAIGLAVGVASWGVLGSSDAGRLDGLVRSVLVTPAPGPVQGSQSAQLAISPDGATLVYGSGTSAHGDLRLWRRPLSDPVGGPLRGAAGGSNPTFSPDGQQVVYYNNRRETIDRVPARGGASVPVHEVGRSPVGISWGEGDILIFPTRQSSGLWLVPVAGGTHEAVTTLAGDGGWTNHVWPHVLPGGRAVLFTVERRAGPDELLDPAESQIAVVDLDTGRQQVLLPRGTSPRYSSTGHLVYGYDGALWAVGFDVDRLEVSTEQPALVQDGVEIAASGAAEYAISRTGTLVYLPLGSDPRYREREFVWVSRDGREQGVLAEPGLYQEFSVSSDDRRVAVLIESRESRDLWIVDLEGTPGRQLTFEPTEREAFPLWTPDGRRVAFGPGPSWKRANGTGEVTALAEGGSSRLFPNAFRRDGRLLIVEDFLTGLVSVSLDEPGAVTTLWDDPSSWARNADLSPDGRWLAYESDEAGPGQWEVWVRSFPDVGNFRQRITEGGGSWALWNPNPGSGQELFYVGTDGMMMAVAIETEPEFRLGTPTVLFETYGYGTSANVGANRRMDVASDGSRFLMFKLDAAFTARREPQFVLNWQEELQRLAPVN